MQERCLSVVVPVYNEELTLAAIVDKLLKLPAFLSRDVVAASAADLADAFSLTGFFLDRYAFAPRGLPVPDARARFVSAILVRNR